MEIRIDGWRRHLIFSAAHFLSDYSKCSRLHGHSYAVHIVISGYPIDGIIMDFEVIKEKIKEIIDEIDHKVIIPEEDVKVKENEVEIIHNKKRYVFPKEDCAILPIKTSSAESIASYILQEFLNRVDINENIDEVAIGIDEGYGQGAWAKRKIK
ncbi:MAG: 6-carboxytetrahydropterin synthase [Thermoplasmata archaeon]|nr:6-carboxytetrahydropterin synthase [Thermoplasmata archaeon]